MMLGFLKKLQRFHNWYLDIIAANFHNQFMYLFFFHLLVFEKRGEKRAITISQSNKFLFFVQNPAPFNSWEIKAGNSETAVARSSKCHAPAKCVVDQKKANHLIVSELVLEKQTSRINVFLLISGRIYDVYDPFTLKTNVTFGENRNAHQSASLVHLITSECLLNLHDNWN